MTYKPPAIPDINNNSVLDALHAIKEIIEAREGLRGPDTLNDRFMSISLLADKVITVLRIRPQDGITGWFDDGVNFRVTLTRGVVTDISASSGAGFAIEL
jgi:hypothetical protein